MYIEDVRHLQRLKANGYVPNAVVDVGVSNGEWFAETYKLWPNAEFHLFEAREEEETEFSKLPVPDFIKYKANFNKALGYVFFDDDDKTEIDCEFYQLDAGSSFYKENTAFPAQVKIKTVYDSATEFAKLKLPQNSFLKLDVQGSEYKILQSLYNGTALGHFDHTVFSAIQLELPLLEYNENAQDLSTILMFMRLMGYSLYDFGPGFRRESDQALFQIDGLFVRTDSPLREISKDKPFWLAEKNYERT